ncbi:hypothetical protein GCN78_11590 [Janthinobacterium rivuli]|uniref:hypothetical protein n=1 Tax=Janthinobacterium sp. FT68W TaxID=2654255 RepID=UPI0012657760|nr:hypothetical protein [Janthinobacterium sp. FT68W]KAB8051657.1 hypothetical protein GCN78_11590 [Janthinobacterium sp. FT68W]
MLKKLELDALKADLSSVEALLESRTREDDPIGYFQFAARKTMLEGKIASVDAKMCMHAELGIFFGGGPVQGSRGINADFAGKALEDIQALISKRFSGREIGPLKQRGRLPFHDQSQMIVTDVMRGSFGFVLEEAGDTVEMVSTPLKDVVDEVSDILSRIGAADEAVFDEAAAQLDERILVTLKQFFQRLDEQGATLRIVQGGRDFMLDRDAVSLARNRIKEMEIIESGKEYVGTLFLLPESRRFDLISSENGERVVLKGILGPEVLKQLAGQQELGEEHIDVRQVTQGAWKVDVKTREIRERNRAPRYVYALSRLKAQIPDQQS